MDPRPRPAIVAEISANHLGNFARAKTLVRLARGAGAWAVKFQTYTPGSMLANLDNVIAAGPWAGRRMADLYSEAMTPHAWHPELFAFARSIGIVPFSSPFSLNDLRLLESLDCPIYKVASFELVDLPLIQAIAKTGKPMILSTGMGTREEIGLAVATARAAGCQHITLLKCTSGYPAPVAECNLAAMAHMQMGFSCDAFGLSDHTLTIGVPIAAAALGASIIEAHLTIARSDGGPDAAFSYTPDELATLVEACRIAAESIGNVRFGPTDSEIPQLALRRSLYWSSGWQRGKQFNMNMARTARPALGLPPSQLEILSGRIIARTVKAGEPVLEEDFDP